MTRHTDIGYDFYREVHMGFVILFVLVGLLAFIVYVIDNWSALQAATDAAQYIANCQRAGVDPMFSYTLSDADKAEAIELAAGVSTRDHLALFTDRMHELTRDTAMPGDDGYDPAVFMDSVREHALLRYAGVVARNRLRGVG